MFNRNFEFGNFYFKMKFESNMICIPKQFFCRKSFVRKDFEHNKSFKYKIE